jgi:hypothetical protein
MNLEEFDNVYANKKGADKIEINCDHPDHPEVLPRLRALGKTMARRNILKNGGQKFICRECCLKFDNPMTKVGKGRQTDESISVQCPRCQKVRDMKKNCYYGSMEEPYQQVCGSCAQEGKVVSEEQKQKISDALSGRELSEEHLAKILKYRENNPDWCEKTKQNLIPGVGGGWNKGQECPEETREKISKANTGKKRTLEQRYNISQGRKKMLEETGGFTVEHRQKISDATIQQYRDGFVPNTHHIRGWHYSPKLQKCVYYRSSYEKRAFMLLDKNDNVLNYSYEAIVVDFKHPDKGITCQYLIDLLVEYADHKKVIEIKPDKCASYPVNVAKTEAAKMYADGKGYDFQVWTETELYGIEDTEKKMRAFLEWLKGINQSEQEPHTTIS